MPLPPRIEDSSQFVVQDPQIPPPHSFLEFRMDPVYSIADTSQIFSPALIIFRDIVADNLDSMIAVAGSASRLRPHVKTHKMREIVAMELDRGIVKHKCATLAEAEMLAQCGANDVFLAYNPVGPNIGRVVRMLEAYPDLQFSCTGDDPRPVKQLSDAVAAIGRKIDVLLDLNIGMNRTGMLPDDKAVALYQLLAKLPGVRPGGLQFYDGHNHQANLAERTTAVADVWKQGSSMRDRLVKLGLPVPRLVAAGTPSFPVLAKIDDPTLELSPGTTVLHDASYMRSFPDLPFKPAALLLTRCVSRPAPGLLTFDLGNKSLAADPPREKRAWFPDIPDAEAIMHSEEHLVIKTADAEKWSPGDETLVMPGHICPCCALHKRVTVVSGGRVVDTWDVASRDRVLTV